MNASLREIVLAVRYGDASLVGESVGYLILGACDRAVAVPRSVDLDGVLVTGEGDVVLDATAVSEDEAERSLRYLLGQLLTLLRTPFPNLARVATRDACGLGHLVTELEAALVPVNRRAARRSLSRLVRETRRSLAKEHVHAAVVDVVPLPTALPAPAPVRAVALPERALPERAMFERALLEPALPGLFVSEPVLREAAQPETPQPGSALPESAQAERALPERAQVERVLPAEAADFEVDVAWAEAGWAEDAPAEDAPAEKASTDPASTDPASAEDASADSHWFEDAQAEQEWVDEVPSLIAGAVTPVRARASQADWGAADEADGPSADAAPIDDFDQALTRVTTAVETLPPPAMQKRSAFNMRRLVTTAELEGPLLPTLASASSSPSSIQDLLHRMRLEGQQTEVVLAGLALLARVDLSPPAPPVG